MLFRKLNLARLIDTNRNPKPLFFIWSLKANALLLVESYLEFWALILLDSDDSVAEITTQGFTLYCRYNGRKDKYTLDILIKTVNSKLFVYEIKEERELIEKEKLEDRLKFIRTKFLNAKYDGFLTSTDAEIREEPNLQNHLCLHRFACGNEPTKEDISKIRMLLGNSPKSFSKLLKYSKRGLFRRDAIWYLMGRNQILVDKTREISPRSKIMWRN